MTLLVGENGTGKSTIVEAVAMAFGLSPEGVFLRAETMHGFYSYLEQHPGHTTRSSTS